MNTQKHLMFVEDNDDDVALFKRAFEKGKCDYKLTILPDGAEAIDYLYRKEKYKNIDPNEIPQLIILDLKLPKINGLEVLEKIKTDTKLKYIPVIILSYSALKQDINKCYELGANSYLIKPVDFNFFVEQIRHLCMYWLMHNANYIA